MTPADTPGPAFPAEDTAAAATTTPSRWQVPGVWQGGLHLLSLNGLVVAQPLLDQLASNPEYILERGMTRAGLTLVCLALLFLPWLAMFGVCSIARCLSRRLGQFLHLACVAFLLCLLTSQVARRLIVGHDLLMDGWQDLLQIAFAVLLTSGGVYAYVRTRFVPALVSYAAIGLLAYPSIFLLSPGVASVFWPTPVEKQTVVGQPQPIVLIVFDGLLGTALMDEQREIDAIRYPNFARLAADATWFRQATTVHPRTDHAVPAILSGNYPVDGTSPVIAEYPRNLLALLHDNQAYDITSFEPYTRLTPEELSLRPPQRTVTAEAGEALWILQQVLWKISLPTATAGALPNLPLEWFSLSIEPRVDRSLNSGKIRYNWDTSRMVQVAHFVDCLEPGERPRLWFAHLALPHAPFLYYPSTLAYSTPMRVDEGVIGVSGPLMEDWGPDELAVDLAWQRYLLQVGAVDHVLGKILDRLQSSGLYDDCLLIVTSDHGYSFRAGKPMRQPIPETLPDLLPVPLFVKTAGQRQGAISDRNVETIDILPTIAEQIGLELPLPVDGESLFSTERARLRKQFVTERGSLFLEAAFPQGDESRRRMLARFGSGTNDRLWTLDVRPELVGQPVAAFPQEQRADLSAIIHSPLRPHSPSEKIEPLIPAYCVGVMKSVKPSQPPFVIAISHRGQIRAVTRTLRDPNYPGYWTTVLPEDREIQHDERFEYWVVDESSGQTVLQPIACRYLFD